MFAALRGWAVGVSEQLRYDVVRRLAARPSDALKASCVFALDADEDAQRRRRVARVALDVLRINRREERVKIRPPLVLPIISRRFSDSPPEHG